MHAAMATADYASSACSVWGISFGRVLGALPSPLWGGVGGGGRGGATGTDRVDIRQIRPG